MRDQIKALRQREQQLLSADQRQQAHRKGRLQARERIEQLLDAGSFQELGALMTLQSHHFNLQDKKVAGDGVITGHGTIAARQVFVYSQDVFAIGGSLGEVQARKIVNLYEQALKTGAPMIGIIDSGGARIQEGLGSLDGYAAIFQKVVHASGIIPQLSIVVGPAAGGAAYTPALTDFVFMVKDLSSMFITGPSVIKAATGEAVSAEELGGALVHNQSSGVSHFLLQDERSCFQKVKDVLSYLPSNHLEAAPMNLTVTAEPQDKLLDLVPVDASKAYDVKAVIRTIVDENSWLEIHKYYARNAVVGLARLNGETIGIVANQPKVLAGCLDIDASDKIARFVRFCDAFHLPIVNLIDVPGYLPGVQQEHDGIIRHGAKILYAYAEATVPKFAVVLRKAYGGGYIALVSKALGYDQVLAWPSAELAVMGAEQAVAVVHHRELAADGSDAFRAQKIAEYRDKFLNPYLAAEQGQVDSVIDPTTTRALLISSLAAWRGKRETRFAKRHGNMPM